MQASRSADEWDDDEFVADPAVSEVYCGAHAAALADDIPTARPLLQEAADRGSPRAAYALATWYLHGDPYGAVDVPRARALLERAAAFDIPEANWDLAIIEDHGKDGPANPEAAFDQYLRAALRGDVDALAEVWRRFAEGDGVEQNARLAGLFADRAEELGWTESGAARSS
jgi:TPR repeat protein